VRNATALQFPSAYLPGDSPAMSSLYRQMEPLVRGDIPVLILGETGVGKEPVARTLHLSSPWAAGPFVAINCAAIPAELLEAELFGIRKGVATGVASREGMFAQAQGGTLFLDEIGDMAPALQAKLLRSLQEKVIRPLGGRTIALNVRVVSATNIEMTEHLDTGRFRKDLYYRLAGYELRVPPLRDCREDIPALVEHFARATARELDKTIPGITVDALRALVEYPWPGNVRQLEYEARRLVYLCGVSQPIDFPMLSPQIRTARCAAPSPATVCSTRGEGMGSAPRMLPDPDEETLNLEAVEKHTIRRALCRSHGILAHAAKLLGISRDALRRRVRRYGLAPTSLGASRSDSQATAKESP